VKNGVATPNASALVQPLLAGVRQSQDQAGGDVILADGEKILFAQEALEGLIASLSALSSGFLASPAQPSGRR